MSSGIAALIAHAGFWTLLAYGWFWEEIRLTGLAVFLLLWTLGWSALPWFTYGDGMFVSYVAILDIALVFMIFKGDVRLT